MQAFLSSGKLRSATFAFSGSDLEKLTVLRQNLLQLPHVKVLSKVSRVRCEILRKYR